LNCCQYLLVSQINDTLASFADHGEQFSHDAANRCRAGNPVRPHSVWKNIQSQIMQTPSGCLVFDDTVVDKNFSHKIALVRRQYRGKVHGIIKGGAAASSTRISTRSWISSGSSTAASMIPPGMARPSSTL